MVSSSPTSKMTFVGVGVRVSVGEAVGVSGCGVKVGSRDGKLVAMGLVAARDGVVVHEGAGFWVIDGGPAKRGGPAIGRQPAEKSRKMNENKRSFLGMLRIYPFVRPGINPA